MYAAASATPNEETKRTQDTPQASRSARINSIPSLFSSSQVASDSTAYRNGEKKTERTFTVLRAQRRRICNDDDASSLDRDLHAPPSAARTMTSARRPHLSGWRHPCDALGRQGCDIRALPSAAGAATSMRHLRPPGPRPLRVDLGRWCCGLHAPPFGLGRRLPSHLRLAPARRGPQLGHTRGATRRLHGRRSSATARETQGVAAAVKEEERRWPREK
jgi:hypothetical protein